MDCTLMLLAGPAAIIESAVLLVAGWLLWRGRATQERYGSGYGSELLAGLLFAGGLHGLDRPMWAESPVFLLRMAFDDLLGVAMGIAMIVVVLESGRARTDELHDKMRRLTLLTTASTQSLSVRELLDSVLVQVVESLGATHGLIRLIEGGGPAAQLVVRASVGFSESFLSEVRPVAGDRTMVGKIISRRILRLPAFCIPRPIETYGLVSRSRWYRKWLRLCFAARAGHWEFSASAPREKSASNRTRSHISSISAIFSV